MREKSKQNLVFNFSFIIIVLSFLFFYVGFGLDLDVLNIKDGIATLSEEYIEERSFKLDGDFYYYENQFLKPNQFEDESYTAKLVHIPGGFNEFNENQNMFGYGTLRFWIEIPKEYIGKNFSLKIQTLSTAAKIWINGNEVAKQGVLGRTENDSLGIYKPTLSNFRANKSLNEVVIQISNFQDIKPIVKGFYIGLDYVILKLLIKSIGKDLFLIGALMTMFIKYFFSYLKRKNQAEYLYFSMLCLFIAFRTMITGERFFIILYPNISWSIFSRSVLILLYASSWMYMGFSAEIFRANYNKFAIKMYKIITIISIALTITMPNKLYEYIVEPFLVLILIYIIYGLILSFKCKYNIYAINKILKFSYLMILSIVIHDILNAYSIIDSIPLISLGIFLLIVVIANVLSDKESHSIMKTEQHLLDMKISNEKLEFKVKERTNEIELKNKRLIEMNRKLKYLSEIDGLTEIANRRNLNQKLGELLKNQYSESNLNLGIIDIDYFKLYNDAYGHVKGDECLKKIAELIDYKTRKSGGFAARYGGEEFIVIHENLNSKEMIDNMKEMVKSVESIKIKHKKSTVSEYITISIGVITQPIKEIESAEEFLDMADILLYKAKTDGRNRAVWL